MLCLMEFIIVSVDNPSKYPQLTNVQLEKLRHLTIMSLATDNKVRLLRFIFGY